MVQECNFNKALNNSIVEFSAHKNQNAILIFLN